MIVRLPQPKLRKLKIGKMNNGKHLNPAEQRKQSRIHSWDRPTFIRALCWAVAVESIFAGFYAAGYYLGGAPPGGPPHNFPHPLILLAVWFHLPTIFTVGWISPILVPIFQTLLLTYFIFVWLRLKMIKVKLY
jgi:hypothetical protein